MTIFDFNVGDKVSPSEKLHSTNLLRYFKFSKDIGQGYLYVHSIDYERRLIECSISINENTQVFAEPNELEIFKGKYNKRFYLPKQRQEFEFGTRVNFPEINCFNVIYLTTIGNTRLVVERGDEENFLNGYIFATESIEIKLKISTSKKLVSLSNINERANKFGKNFLEELLKNNCLLNENETLQF